MENKIEDYLHLYLGCLGITSNGHKEGELTLTPDLLRHILLKQWHYPFKPILRPLSSQTREEQLEELSLSKSWGEQITGAEHCARITAHRLKKSFDLFGLIEAGLAIAIKPPEDDNALDELCNRSNADKELYADKTDDYFERKQNLEDHRTGIFDILRNPDNDDYDSKMQRNQEREEKRLKDWTNDKDEIE